MAPRVALVTGGGKGIGRAIALALSEGGYSVSICGRNEGALEVTANAIRSKGGKVLVVKADVSDEYEVKLLVEETMKRYGRIDVLVNNAGIAGPHSPVHQLSLQEWEETIRVNLTGTFLCCREVAPIMIERKWGRIINIGSTMGRNPAEGRAPYAASKMALVALTRCLAKELGRYNITVNCISPGPVEGERIESMMARVAGQKGEAVEVIRERMLSALPLGRFVRPEEVAGLVAFLASDEAENITGQDILINSGAYMP